MRSSKHLLNLALVVLALCSQTSAVGAEDLQLLTHRMVEYAHSAAPGWEKWESDKKALSSHSQEELARALITEVEIDRGDPRSNHERDVSVRRLFEDLHLPPSLVCEELDKPVSPQTKASLILGSGLFMNDKWDGCDEAA